MHDSFDRVYGNPDDPFYYGLKPSEKLQAFLNETHPQVGEALDLGCGEGRNALLLARYGYHVHAVNVSSQGIQKLEHYARSQGLHSITYTVADARAFPFPPNSYNLIVAVTILDHVTQEEGKKVAESLMQALKPGGFVFVEVFTISDPGAQLSKEEGESISETATFVKHYFDEGELATWFSRLEMVQYEEYMKYDDSHGEPHFHGLARFIGRRP
jgi:tellurite methyltransferase